jgi:predicted outer membrane repeat protein
MVSYPVPRWLWLVTALLLGGTAARAQTIWYVDDNAPGDPGPGDPTISDPLENGSPEHPFDAIQEAVNQAVNGDVVLVLDGTYAGPGNLRVEFGGRLITVRSENGPETCTIDCSVNPYQAFYVHNGETPDAVIEGFTISNARSPALLIQSQAAATVRNCIFRENPAVTGPGAAYLFYASLSSTTLFDHCSFIANSSGGSHGGAVYALSSLVAFVECEFRDNHVANKGGAICIEGGEVSAVNCSFVHNSSNLYGGGLHINGYEGHVDLANCVFVGNHAGAFGGGIASWDVGPSVMLVYLRDCTFAGNGAELGRSIAHQLDTGNTIMYLSWNSIYRDGPYGESGEGIYGGHGAFGFYYCDVGGGVFEGCIDADPLFVQPPDPGPDEEWGTEDDDHGDLRLQAGSPCIDAADAGEVPADIFDLDGDGDTTEPIPYDLDGQPRCVDDPATVDTGVGFPCVDMGAYEFQPVSDVLPWEDLAAIAREPAIRAAGPSPFNLRTTIGISASRAGAVTLAVYDVHGRRLRTLWNGVMEAGRHSVVWEGIDERGGMAPTGIYLVRLERVGDSPRSVKVILTR